MKKLTNKSSLPEIQKYVLEEGIKLGFGKLNGLQRCLMLGEEVGELFKSIRKHQKIIIAKNSKVDPIEDELADILKQLCAVANFYKVDLQSAFIIKDKADLGRWDKTLVK